LKEKMWRIVRICLSWMRRISNEGKMILLLDLKMGGD
jgi:hypothetical protein